MIERNLSLTTTITVATYAVMISIGAMNASYGTVLPFLEGRFAVDSSVIGLLGTAQTVGGVLGNLSTAFLEGRFTAGQRTLFGGAGFAIGAMAFALAIFFHLHFALALLALFLMGFGVGLFQVNYANLFSRGFGARSGAVMSIMSTAFAVGSIIGPILAAWLAQTYAWLPAIFGALTLGFAMLIRPARDMPKSADHKETGGLTTETWLFAAMVAFYVIAEQGAGFWGVTHLVAIGWKETDAAWVFSSFWTVLLVGRLMGAGLAVRFSDELILLVGALGSTIAFLLANIAVIAAPAYLVAGFFFAPTFPIGLTWMARRNPASIATTTYLIAGSAGAAVGIPLIGLCKTMFGATAIPAAIAIANFVCFALVLVLRAQQTKRL